MVINKQRSKIGGGNK